LPAIWLCRSEASCSSSAKLFVLYPHTDASISPSGRRVYVSVSPGRIWLRRFILGSHSGEHCHETRYCLSLALCFGCGFGQQNTDPVTSVGKEILSHQETNLVAAVEEMPADRFGYKPTPQQMSFTHLVLHMAESNNYFCAKAGDVPEPKTQELKETDGKDKLVAALKASFDFCNTAMPKVTDAKLGDTIEVWGGRKASRAFALIALTNDWADHYSAAAMYLRLNGLLPPTANK
jgi:uncharacterized damage-inducible protein DinB